MPFHRINLNAFKQHPIDRAYTAMSVANHQHTLFYLEQQTPSTIANRLTNNKRLPPNPQTTMAQHPPELITEYDTENIELS